MAKKPMTDKAKARMYFKRWKAGMTLTLEEILMVKKYYPFMRKIRGVK